jgi:membrane-associated HD superfamily phosphohydrolase
LDELISSGIWMPGTGRFLIDRDKLTTVSNQLRESVPVDLREAQELLQMRDRVINQALTEANRVKSAADEDAKMRVAESEVTRDAQNQADMMILAAQSRAERVLSEAEAKARARIEGADSYALETLQQLEEDLTETVNTVRRGLESLNAQREKSSV